MWAGEHAERGKRFLGSEVPLPGFSTCLRKQVRGPLPAAPPVVSLWQALSLSRFLLLHWGRKFTTYKLPLSGIFLPCLCTQVRDKKERLSAAGPTPPVEGEALKPDAVNDALMLLLRAEHSVKEGSPQQLERGTVKGSPCPLEA